MPPIEVIEILSKNGTASIALVREFLKRQLIAEKQEIDSVRAALANRTPTADSDDHPLRSTGSSSHRFVPDRICEEAERDPGALGSEGAARVPSHALFGVRGPARPARSALHVSPLVPSKVSGFEPSKARCLSHTSSSTCTRRCFGENESQCPNCARTHGVIREIRKNNEQLANRHDLFLSEVAESDDSFATVASAFGRGWMSLTSAK